MILAWLGEPPVVAHSPWHAAGAAHRMLPAGRCVSAVAEYRAIKLNDDALPTARLLIACCLS